jgi:hypothetical protein
MKAHLKESSKLFIVNFAGRSRTANRFSSFGGTLKFSGEKRFDFFKLRVKKL